MIRINLLPQVDLFEKPPLHIYGALAVFILAALVLGGWWWSLNTSRSGLQAELQDLQLKREQLAAVQAKLDQLEANKTLAENKIQVIKDLKAKQSGPVELLNVVIASMPETPGVWLVSMTQRERDINMEGNALDVAFMTEFIAAMDNSPVFSVVDLQSYEETQDNTVHFRINCQIAERAEEGS